MAARREEGGTFGIVDRGNPITYQTCPDGSTPREGVLIHTYRCSDGASWICYPSASELAQLGDPGPCGPPFVYNLCTDRDCPGCKVTGQSRNGPTSDPSNDVGDPITLTSGQLEQSVTDLDLGGGLRFTRHYASAYYHFGGSGGHTRLPIVTSMGAKWRHSLQWEVVRQTTVGSGGHLVRVASPLGLPEVFMLFDPLAGGEWNGSQQPLGSLEGDFAGELVYTAADGTRVTFDANDLVTEIAPPGARPIAVTRAGDTVTFSDGTQSLAITHFPSSHPSFAGKVWQVSGGGKTFSYGYVLDPNGAAMLDTVTEASGVGWDYGYQANTTEALLATADRDNGSILQRVATWTWGFQALRQRVTSADEPTLPQKLWFTYYDPGQVGKNIRTRIYDHEPLGIHDESHVSARRPPLAAGRRRRACGGVAIGWRGRGGA